jgi:hypothetical protein
MTTSARRRAKPLSTCSLMLLSERRSFPPSARGRCQKSLTERSWSGYRKTFGRRRDYHAAPSSPSPLRPAAPASDSRRGVQRRSTSPGAWRPMARCPRFPLGPGQPAPWPRRAPPFEPLGAAGEPTKPPLRKRRLRWPPAHLRPAQGCRPGISRARSAVKGATLTPYQLIETQKGDRHDDHRRNRHRDPALPHRHSG